MRIVLAAAVLTAAFVVSSPAHAQIAVTTPTLEEREVLPGEAYTGVVRVRNGGTATARARIYQNDYQPTIGGARWGAPGSHARSSAGWITVSAAVLTLAPGEEAVVRYDVRVPQGVAGTFWSVVMVEGETEPPARARGVTVTPVVRFAVQLATHVGNAAAPELAFGAPSLVPVPSGHRLALEVTNGGTRAGRVELRLELFHPDGTPAGTYEARRGLLYPGTALEQVFELGRLAPGPYRALVIADAGGDEVFGADYTLRL
jgi:hypothetical protein